MQYITFSQLMNSVEQGLETYVNDNLIDRIKYIKVVDKINEDKLNEIKDSDKNSGSQKRIYEWKKKNWGATWISQDYSGEEPTPVTLEKQEDGSYT